MGALGVGVPESISLVIRPVKFLGVLGLGLPGFCGFLTSTTLFKKEVSEQLEVRSTWFAILSPKLGVVLPEVVLGESCWRLHHR